MIVVCTSCRARFRVADEKVGPRGARVRCAKCKNVFTVGPVATPEASAPPAPPSPPAAAPARPPPIPRHDDPFAAPAPPAVAEPATGANDPFASFATGAGTPEPTPPGFGLETPAAPFSFPAEPAPARAAQAQAAPQSGFLPVTSLADLEKTGARFLVGSPPPVADESDLGLALEERTPVGIPLDRDLAVAPGPASEAAEPFGEEFPAPDPAPEVGYGLDYELPPPQPAEAGGEPVALVTEEPPFEVKGPAPRAPKSAPAPAPEAVPQRGEEAGPVEADTFGGRRLHGVLMNALSLALLLVFTAGILLYWRGESVLNLVRRAARAPASALSSVAKSNGYYLTSSGRPLVYVRGEVRSQSAVPVGRVRVRGEMVQGGRVVARAEGLAGAVPTPEELAALVSREEQEKLATVLALRAPRQLPPGQELPFVLTFVDYPPDMGEVTFRVTADPAPGP